MKFIELLLIIMIVVKSDFAIFPEDIKTPEINILKYPGENHNAIDWYLSQGNKMAMLYENTDPSFNKTKNTVSTSSFTIFKQRRNLRGSNVLDF